MKKLLTTLSLLALAGFPALAWNHTGHKIVAELAWRNLGTAKQKALSDLLKDHPHYSLLLATNVPSAVGVDEWAFLNASVWPDMVRPARSGDSEKSYEITKYHRSPWHYINIPYVLPADAARHSAADFTIPTTNILWALSNSLATLNDPRGAPADRAVSLCWVLHLVGDLHQPLHAATLLSDKYPHGDQGGNALAVADASQTPLNLHSFWDQILDTADSYEFITTVADNIATASQYDPRNLKEYKSHRTIRSWADESFAAAVAFAYAEGHLKFADWKDYGAGKVPAAEVPRLKSTYILNANDVARRRVSLAGRRLADVLKEPAGAAK
jgi:hypothetical protein